MFFTCYQALNVSAFVPGPRHFSESRVPAGQRREGVTLSGHHLESASQLGLDDEKPPVTDARVLDNRLVAYNATTHSDRMLFFDFVSDRPDEALS